MSSSFSEDRAALKHQDAASQQSAQTSLGNLTGQLQLMLDELHQELLDHGVKPMRLYHYVKRWFDGEKSWIFGRRTGAGYVWSWEPLEHFGWIILTSSDSDESEAEVTLLTTGELVYSVSRSYYTSGHIPPGIGAAYYPPLSHVDILRLQHERERLLRRVTELIGD